LSLQVARNVLMEYFDTPAEKRDARWRVIDHGVNKYLLAYLVALSEDTDFEPDKVKDLLEDFKTEQTNTYNDLKGDASIARRKCMSIAANFVDIATVSSPALVG